MINSRKDLYIKAKETYEALLARLAKRYNESYQYVISDTVSFECTRLEDFLRPMWGIAPFLKEGDLYVTVDGEKISATDFFNKIMYEGTAEDSPKRFDRNVIAETEYKFANQSVTEIAGYLVAVYFAREELWDSMPAGKRDTIAKWIKKWAFCAIKHSWQNNHYWYPIYCVEILKQLGYDCSEVDEDMQKGYDFLESLYYGNGWYSDGELGRFDYYEAWAHHTYTLLWILIADKNRPDYEKKCNEYRKRSEEYLRYFINYFDTDGGMAAYGRSIGYRFAATAPFSLAVMTGCDFDAGLAKSVILKNTDYFYSNSSPTEDGCFPVGYLYASSGFGEGYASDGAISCYTEGFLCLLADEDSPLWTAEAKKLPSECGKYLERSPLEGLQIMLAGDAEKNGVTLYNNSLHYYQDKLFTHRFNDMAGSYSKFAYNSRSGYGLSTADLVSFDNMISLATPDGTMVSHRRRIIDNRIENGVMISSHIPFANDEGTKITTYLVPLENGWHVRIHKVVLAQKYSVSEGGFSIGVKDDGYNISENLLTYRNFASKILLTSDCKAKYNVKRGQPGMHLLCPQSLYPAYQTGALEAGEYLFVTSVYFSTDGKEEPAPQISIDQTTVTITLNNTQKTVMV